MDDSAASTLSAFLNTDSWSPEQILSSLNLHLVPLYFTHGASREERHSHRISFEWSCKGLLNTLGSSVNIPRFVYDWTILRS